MAVGASGLPIAGDDPRVDGATVFSFKMVIQESMLSEQKICQAPIMPADRYSNGDGGCSQLKPAIGRLPLMGEAMVHSGSGNWIDSTVCPDYIYCTIGDEFCNKNFF